MCGLATSGLLRCVDLAESLSTSAQGALLAGYFVNSLRGASRLSVQRLFGRRGFLSAALLKVLSAGAGFVIGSSMLGSRGSGLSLGLPGTRVSCTAKQFGALKIKDADQPASQR